MHHGSGTECPATSSSSSSSSRALVRPDPCQTRCAAHRLQLPCTMETGQNVLRQEQQQQQPVRWTSPLSSPLCCAQASAPKHHGSGAEYPATIAAAAASLLHQPAAKPSAMRTGFSFPALQRCLRTTATVNRTAKGVGQWCRTWTEACG
jgi:hypothetical protein